MTSLSRRRMFLWMIAIAAVSINIGLLMATYSREDTSGCAKGVPCDPRGVLPYFRIGSTIFLIGVVLALGLLALGLRAAWRRIRLAHPPVRRDAGQGL